jgi:hypothetical protein
MFEFYLELIHFGHFIIFNMIGIVIIISTKPPHYSGHFVVTLFTFLRPSLLQRPKCLGIHVSDTHFSMISSLNTFCTHVSFSAGDFWHSIVDGRSALRHHEAARGINCVTLCMDIIVHKLARSNTAGIALSVDESGAVLQMCRFAIL